MTVSRDYNCSDVKLLVVCATINESFLANKEPLIAVQSSWADPYGDNLKNCNDVSVVINPGFKKPGFQRLYIV